MLYANNKLSNYLSNNFVLHWQSVRPVPVITIDFGDGRIVKRTITGNSVHYLLDANGQMIDAIPGLYDAGTFEHVLRLGYDVWQNIVNQGRSSRQALLIAYHQQKLIDLHSAFQKGLDATSANLSLNLSAPVLVTPQINPIVPAADAIEIAVTKSAIELPMLSLINKKPLSKTKTYADIKVLLEKVDDNVWKNIALFHGINSKLDVTSKDLISYQNPALAAVATTKSKRLVESPLLKMIRKFENNIVIDTMRNEYEFHSRIHQWFVDGASNQDVAVFNERVYSEIFLTPSSDAWLGLEVNDLYTGLME